MFNCIASAMHGGAQRLCEYYRRINEYQNISDQNLRPLLNAMGYLYLKISRPIGRLPPPNEQKLTDGERDVWNIITHPPISVSLCRFFGSFNLKDTKPAIKSSYKKKPKSLDITTAPYCAFFSVH